AFEHQRAEQAATNLETDLDSGTSRKAFGRKPQVGAKRPWFAGRNDRDAIGCRRDDAAVESADGAPFNADRWADQWDSFAACRRLEDLTRLGRTDLAALSVNREIERARRP